MPEKEEQAHSMCVSLRLDPATLKELNEERKEETLSAMMNVRIKNTIESLVGCAKKGGK
jgi:hypothetical protein